MKCTKHDGSRVRHGDRSVRVALFPILAVLTLSVPVRCEFVRSRILVCARVIYDLAVLTTTARREVLEGCDNSYAMGTSEQLNGF